MNRETPFPFPEAVPEEAGQNWGVRNLEHVPSPMTDMDHKVMYVPLNEEPWARNVRAHELGHAAWSPPIPPQHIAVDLGVSTAAVVLTEELRVNENLRRTGINLREGLMSAEDSEAAATEGLTRMSSLSSSVPERLSAAIRLRATTWKTGDGVVVERMIRDGKDPELTKTWTQASELVGRLYGMLTGGLKSDELIPLSRMEQGAGWISQYLVEIDETSKTRCKGPSGDDAEEKAKKPGQRKEEGRYEERVNGDRIFQKLTQLFKESEWGMGKKDYRPKEDGKPQMADIPKVLTNNWGDMEIIEHPRPNLFPQQKHLRLKARATDAGDQIRYLFRYTIDGMIFKKKIRDAGGTVLIDGSGSMSLTREQIRQLLMAAPAATVALYAGVNDEKGVLKILAKDGKMVDRKHIKSPGSGNLVDGPALFWLMRQQGPRVWVSDGGVSGRGDCADSAHIHADCHRLRVVGKITRFADVDSALAAFRERLTRGTEFARSRHRAILERSGFYKW